MHRLQESVITEAFMISFSWLALSVALAKPESLPHCQKPPSMRKTSPGRAAFKDVVFNQLLGQGRAAAPIVIGQHAYCRTQDRTDVDSVVLPETGILNGNEGID